MKAWKRIEPTKVTKVGFRQIVTKTFEMPDGRIETINSPHVSSAVANDGVPGLRSEDTTMPSRVQVSTSMCGNTPR